MNLITRRIKYTNFDIQEKMYYATYRCFLDSIMKNGLTINNDSN